MAIKLQPENLLSVSTVDVAIAETSAMSVDVSALLSDPDSIVIKNIEDKIEDAYEKLRDFFSSFKDPAIMRAYNSSGPQAAFDILNDKARSFSELLNTANSPGFLNEMREPIKIKKGESLASIKDVENQLRELIQKLGLSFDKKNVSINDISTQIRDAIADGALADSLTQISAKTYASANDSFIQVQIGKLSGVQPYSTNLAKTSFANAVYYLAERIARNELVNYTNLLDTVVPLASKPTASVTQTSDGAKVIFEATYYDDKLSQLGIEDLKKEVRQKMYLLCEAIIAEVGPEESVGHAFRSVWKKTLEQMLFAKLSVESDPKKALGAFYVGLNDNDVIGFIGEVQTGLMLEIWGAQGTVWTGPLLDENKKQYSADWWLETANVGIQVKNSAINNFDINFASFSWEKAARLIAERVGGAFSVEQIETFISNATLMERFNVEFQYVGASHTPEVHKNKYFAPRREEIVKLATPVSQLLSLLVDFAMHLQVGEQINDTFAVNTIFIVNGMIYTSAKILEDVRDALLQSKRSSFSIGIEGLNDTGTGDITQFLKKNKNWSQTTKLKSSYSFQ